MAVAHSASSKSATGNKNTTSVSWTHTQTGTPNGVLVFVLVWDDNTQYVTSVTYGSVTLTKVTGGVANDTAGEPGRIDTYFAGSGLPSGNQTITVNWTSTGKSQSAFAATVTAAKDTEVTGIVLLEENGTLAEQNVDDGSPGTNSLRYACIESGLATAPGVGSNTTSLQTETTNQASAALARETTAGQGSRPVGFSSATSDDRAVVHLAIRETLQSSLDATVGTFTLSGTTTGLLFNRKLDKTTTSFTLSGKDSSLQRNLQLITTVGQFNDNGINVDLLFNRQLINQLVAFSVNGINTSLLFNRLLDQQVGTYALNGLDAQFNFIYNLNGTVSNYNVGLNNSDLLKNSILNSNTGSYNFIGNDTSLERILLLNLLKTDYLIDGINTDFNRSYVLNNTLGFFNLSGFNVDFYKALNLDLSSGNFIVTGLPSDVYYNRKLNLLLSNFSMRLQSNGDFFWYRTTQTIKPVKYRITKRNEWILGRATHMGRRGL